MPPDDAHDHELRPLSLDRSRTSQEMETEDPARPLRRPSDDGSEDNDSENEMLEDLEMPLEDDTPVDERLARRTVRKLDFILLPFLALLFLLNSLDKSNIGNAETAGFTRDAGLSRSDLNTALAYFFAFFVALQPVGAALGRTIGMARWVPACMSLWGLCTILHIFVHKRWQLICLRIAIASLEAGFYPTTVSYLSLFYTRYEFAVRLGFFYGQTAVAGALGGVLSWAVFSRFPQHNGDESPEKSTDGQWKSWEILFLIEGSMTIVVALVGFFWLPHSADTAWFFNARERKWAEERILLDREGDSKQGQTPLRNRSNTNDTTNSAGGNDEEAHHRLLDGQSERYDLTASMISAKSAMSMTADSGLSRQDVLSAIFSYNIWHLLVVNILSAIPATAFGVFLPLVIRQLSPSLNLSPAASNLLSSPPFVCGAIFLFIFTRWSDRSHQRLVPILWGLGFLLLGLIITILAPHSNYKLRYVGLCILLSGSFIASPLTIAWISDNTPVPGKRAILLGINGWGNLAGVFSALLFVPEDEATGYSHSLVVTLICVAASFAGFIAFWIVVLRENTWREGVVKNWTADECEREEKAGDMALPVRSGLRRLSTLATGTSLASRLGLDGARRGDEKVTYRYGF